MGLFERLTGDLIGLHSSVLAGDSPAPKVRAKICSIRSTTSLIGGGNAILKQDPDRPSPFQVIFGFYPITISESPICTPAPDRPTGLTAFLVRWLKKSLNKKPKTPSTPNLSTSQSSNLLTPSERESLLKRAAEDYKTAKELIKKLKEK